jgi:feruloyl esterase
MQRLVTVVIVFCLFNAQGAVAAGAPASEARARCEQLAGGRFSALDEAPTWVTGAKYVPATSTTVAYCAVDGYVNPTVGIGIWLPIDNWNGKFIVRGCGGSCGTVAMDLACPEHIRDGYACLHTDMGHRSTLTDNNWAANNLPGQIDFGFRATHVATLAGKAIVSAFYTQQPRLSYFFGCSTGGRQGMVEAQRFPTDFDAMVVIAPAPGSASDYESHRDLIGTFNLRPDGTSILLAREVDLVHRAVLAECDINDGVKDGLIGDPRQCRFDPARLLCKGTEVSDCLTTEQVSVVNKIYASGALRGTEPDWIGKYVKKPTITGFPEQRPYSQSRGDRVIIDSFNDWSNPDLSRARAHGTKIIAVQGWNDPQIDPTVLIGYYEVATRTMGGPAATAEFFRLFMVPGMEHCSTGTGAYAIDYMGAMENWYERGQAPQKLVGIHPKPGAPLDFFSFDLPLLDPMWVEFSRPFFPYPKTAAYSGKGDPNDERSFIAR